MNYSLTFRWAIAVLILLTVGWKMAILPDDAIDLNADLVTFLERNKFSIALADRIVNPDTGGTNVPIIQASSDSCTLLVAALNTDGSNQRLVEKRLAGTARYFVVFGGKVYTKQPIFMTVTNNLWSRFFTKLGLGCRQLPAIAVGSDASCNAELLPWADLHW